MFHPSNKLENLLINVIIIMCWIWHQKVREMVKSCIKWFTTRKPHTYFSASSTKYKCLKIWWLAKIIVTLKCQNQKFKNHNRYNHRGHSYWNFLYCGWLLQSFWCPNGKIHHKKQFKTQISSWIDHVKGWNYGYHYTFPQFRLSLLEAFLQRICMCASSTFVSQGCVIQSFCGTPEDHCYSFGNLYKEGTFGKMYRHKFRR